MDPQLEARIYAIERPSSKLATLYFIRSLAALFAFPFVFVPLFLKYISLRYQFDAEGVGASWGVFYKRQIYLTYARIQDIHVNRSLVERWLGLGTVDVQTASGNASAELSIVGLEEFDAIRDFLYTRMRGARGLDEDGGESTDADRPESEAMTLLREIRDELRALRDESNSGGGHV
ncbi:MAG: PH domain-containing protein [bacterium]|nr:PH domain-containing protein [bacterium]